MRVCVCETVIMVMHRISLYNVSHWQLSKTFTIEVKLGESTSIQSFAVIIFCIYWIETIRGERKGYDNNKGCRLESNWATAVTMVLP